MDVDQSPSQGELQHCPHHLHVIDRCSLSTRLDTSITLTVKCLKPSLSITVTAQTTDTVADLKTLVSKSSSSAPAAATQRLLLKGKALTGTKLLKEYDIQDGATIHLLLKAVTNTTEASAVSASSSSSPGAAPPSLTITTSLDDSKPNKAVPMTEADIDVPPKGPQPQISSAAFHSTVSEPRFWQRIHTLCVSEFAYEDDADAVWESFLGSMKGKLSAGEAAKIRDVVGVRGE